MKTPLEQDCWGSRPYRLKNQIQPYEWGGRDDRAFIAHLIGITAEPGQAFAELWMGTHPSAPSHVVDPETGIRLLSDWISDDPPARLGDLPSQRHGQQLPYLFKVLSADQSLSIQAHPNKAQAKLLHKLNPEQYPDENHKPEIAIALDYLDALVGFITRDEYLKLLVDIPELQMLRSLDKSHGPNIKDDILSLLKLSLDDPGRITRCIQQIQTRLLTQADPSPDSELFLKEYERYGPSDIGLLFILLLKRVRLNAGEAIYLPPGVPHAYLKGNIVECMANSDNVVRLGLTHKFCDAAALAQILDFTERDDFLVETRSDGFQTEYLTPAAEYKVKSLALLQGESRAFTYHAGLTLFLLVEGEIAFKWGANDHICTCMYRRGDVFIAPASLSSFTLQSKNHCKLFLVEIPA